MQIVLVLYLMLFEMSASTQYNEDDLNFVCGDHSAEKDIQSPGTSLF